VLTVLFATRNRAKLLYDVLNEYVNLESPPGGWTLVVVDNGSTDSSPGVLEQFRDRLPLVCASETASGKNAALNTGLAHVAGDLVVLTDDDTFPRRDWLVQLRASADANPTVGIFAGQVLPRWESDPPRWLARSIPLAPTYTVSDSNLPAGPIEGHQVFGPNMAVRAEVFAAGHHFDASIGPSSSASYAMGSETEFVLRVMGHGVTAWYSPDAIVEHFVRATQMRVSWILGRAMRFGRGQCRLHTRLPRESPQVWGFRQPPQIRPRLLGIPLSLVYQLCRKVGALIVAGFQFDREKVYRALFALCYVWGYTQEVRDAAD
jgi:glycosyltransferase involved in cell wall biosynthesis